MCVAMGTSVCDDGAPACGDGVSSRQCDDGDPCVRCGDPVCVVMEPPVCGGGDPVCVVMKTPPCGYGDPKYGYGDPCVW